MSKSIKLKNNIYWDSKSIVHNKKKLSDIIYPVGSIYLSVNSINPSTIFGGTWEQVKDRFLLGCGDTYSNGKTGGASTINLSHVHTTGNHTLTLNELPKFEGVSYIGTTENTWGLSINRTNYKSSVLGGGLSHNHGNTGYSLNNSQSIMPPYLAVYIWKRTK